MKRSVVLGNAALSIWDWQLAHRSWPVILNWLCARSQVFDSDITHGNLDGYSLSVEPPRASDLSKRINALLADLRRGRSNYAGCFVVRQGGRVEGLPRLVQGFQALLTFCLDGLPISKGFCLSAFCSRVFLLSLLLAVQEDASSSNAMPLSGQWQLYSSRREGCMKSVCRLAACQPQ
jgi:hypothetical protein